MTALSSTEGISPVHHRAVVRVQTLGSGALERLQTPRRPSQTQTESKCGEVTGGEIPCRFRVLGAMILEKHFDV